MGRIKTPNGNFHGMCVFHFHGHLHRDEYKPKGLELVEKANGTHIFSSDISVGNLGLPLKTFRLFRKFFGWANKNSLHLHSNQNVRIVLVNGKHSVAISLPFCQ